MKRILPFVLLSVLILMLTGCNNVQQVTMQKEQTILSFSWWGNDSRNEYTIEAIHQFEKLHPDIKVQYHYSEWSAYQNWNKVKMYSHTESDVMQINYSWLNEFSRDGNGYYDLFRLSDKIALSNFSAKELEYGTLAGKLNALPIAMNTMTYYINESLYASFGLKPPTTWDELFQAAAVMNGKAYPLAMNRKGALFTSISYAEQLYNKQMITQNGTLLFSPAELQTILDLYVRFVRENVTPQAEYYDKTKIQAGEYAGFVTWVSDAESYCQSSIDAGSTFTIGEYLRLTPDTTLFWYVKPATMYAISEHTEHPEEAAMLLDFLLNSTEMASLQGIEKGIPISDAANQYLNQQQQLSGIQYDAFSMMEAHANELLLLNPYIENTRIQDAFSTSWNEVLYENTTSEEEAVILYEELTSILKSLNQ